MAPKDISESELISYVLENFSDIPTKEDAKVKLRKIRRTASEPLLTYNVLPMRRLSGWLLESLRFLLMCVCELLIPLDHRDLLSPTLFEKSIWTTCHSRRPPCIS